jgi:hypothetical protein
LPLAVGWALELWIGPDPAAFGGATAALVLGLALECGLLSFFMTTLQFAPLSGRSLWSLMRRTYFPVQPYRVVAAAIAAGTAHAYRTLGVAAAAGCLAILIASEPLLRTVATTQGRAKAIAELDVERSRMLGEALTVEERERERLAAYLHDEPLQLLVTAQQELDAARRGGRQRSSGRRRTSAPPCRTCAARSSMFHRCCSIRSASVCCSPRWATALPRPVRRAREHRPPGAGDRRRTRVFAGTRADHERRQALHGWELTPRVKGSRLLVRCVRIIARLSLTARISGARAV